MTWNYLLRGKENSKEYSNGGTGSSPLTTGLRQRTLKRGTNLEDASTSQNRDPNLVCNNVALTQWMVGKFPESCASGVLGYNVNPQWECGWTSLEVSVTRWPTGQPLAVGERLSSRTRMNSPFLAQGLSSALYWHILPLCWPQGTGIPAW